MSFTFQQKLELGVALSKHLEDLQTLLPDIANEAARTNQVARIEAVQDAQVKLQRLNP